MVHSVINITDMIVIKKNNVKYITKAAEASFKEDKKTSD